MKQNPFLEIKTERLFLRRLKQSDWEMISYLRSNKEVNEFVKRPSAESKEKALEFISKINRGIKDRGIYYWTITERKRDEMIGSICLWNFSKDLKMAEVGYDLSPKFQRKGIMNESLKSVLDAEMLFRFMPRRPESLSRGRFRAVGGPGRRAGENPIPASARPWRASQ